MNPREPRERDERYLKLLRKMPCVISGRHGVEAAHIRYGSAAHGKRPTGMQERPHDRWALPLTPELHRLASDAQHAGNEAAFWRRHRMDPIKVCIDAYAAYQVAIQNGSFLRAEEAVEAILMRHRIFRT